MKYDNGEAYDLKTKGSYYDFWFEIIDHYLDIYLPEKGEILDAGGGTGEFSIRVTRLRTNISVVNLDISQSMLDQAERKFRKLKLQPRVSNKLGDIQKLPFLDEQFDYVMCFGDAISFCPNVELGFSELVRVAKPQGYIHLSVNSFWGNYHAMLSQNSKHNITFDDLKKYMDTRILHINGNSTGCRSFTLQELKSLADRHTLKIAKKFGAPVFSAPDEWLRDNHIYPEIKKLQYMFCEYENIMEFGNHLNIIYKKI